MITAFIPLRGGSKSIPLKNIKVICGKPLAQWVIDAANNCNKIDRVVVSTDSERISDTVKKCEIFWRSDTTATDIASSELALIEFCKSNIVNPEDIIIFIQATSPMLTALEISSGIDLIESGNFDSVLSVVRQKRFLWDKSGVPSYNINQRPRRQDWEGYFVENGAFYISRVRDILSSQCRISGKIGIVECSEESFYEIDEPSDWIIVEHLLKLRLNNDYIY